jgi:general secretion pathway protein F
MAAFRYTAIDRSGRMSSGVMDAPDAAQVIARLQRDGNIPVRTEPADQRSFIAALLATEFGNTGLRRQDVAHLTRELSIMLGAGQDLDRALRFLVETAPKPRVARLVEQLRAAVRDGGSLAAALAAQPQSFSKLYVGLVRAGEAGGALAATLDRLALLLERQRKLTATVQSAMIYPGMLALVSIGSVTLLLTEVLPQFAPLFAENGAPMPASTAFLLRFGGLIRHDGLYGLLGLIGLGLVVRQALQRPGVRLVVDRLVLRLPVIGGLTREVLAARFTRTLGSLLLNGVPLIAALGIVRDVIGNRAAIVAVEQATSSAKGGAGLAAPLAAAQIFPVRTMHLLRLGEETAQLGAIALRAADIHDEAVQLGIQRLVSLLVPAITILMGAIIGGIVSSLMLSMLSLNNLAG